MKALAQTLGVARATLYEPKRGKRRRYGPRPDDGTYLGLLRPHVDARPSYGYRRLTALLNRELKALGRPSVNPKRIYRIMRVYGLLLERHAAKPARPHEGRIIADRSDQRWCADEFEIACFNGDEVHVGFSLDCCDREVMSWVASTSDLTADLVRDLMAESVEARFGTMDRLPHSIEWLSDNGGAFTATETRMFAWKLRLIPRTTPAYSPESNGMAEAFVKTFKRDYVAWGDLSDARTVIRQLAAWFEDYNTVHPHKGLKMRSPREYRQLLATG